MSFYKKPPNFWCAFTNIELKLEVIAKNGCHEAFEKAIELKIPTWSLGF